jgi:hypothetical protein
MCLWVLGQPEAAIADADHALKDARETGQVANVMYALVGTTTCFIENGRNETADTLTSELLVLAEENVRRQMN